MFIAKILNTNLFFKNLTTRGSVSFYSSRAFSSSSSSEIDSYRTHHCGKLGLSNENETVRVAGWLQAKRGTNFLLVRDLHGLVQVVLGDEFVQKNLELIKRLTEESVVSVRGRVRRRPAGQENSKMTTGRVEVLCDEMEVLSAARSSLPFTISDFNRPNETTRLRYRYLDLRFREMQRNLTLRSSWTHRARQFLNENGFLDIETPTLFRRTPGGAREFIVPTNKSGQFYCLTQSPQQFKQLLMIGGLDRYYQIARCYRDENAKPDRQPEFTQIDIEMSFAKSDDIIGLIERLVAYCWPSSLSSPPHAPFTRMKFAEAMQSYGVDKPDLRFDMRLHNVSDLFVSNKEEEEEEEAKSCGITRIDSISSSSRFYATAIRVPRSYNEHAQASPSEIESVYKSIASANRVNKSFTFLALRNEAGNQVSRFMSKQARRRLLDRLGCESDDLVLVLAGEAKNKLLETAGKLRLAVADLIDRRIKERGGAGCGGKSGNELPLLRDASKFNFVWVVDFPLFTRNEDTGRLESSHHPFTAPVAEHLDWLREKRNLEEVIGLHYDLVLNGSEVAGGSIRIHDAALQRHVLGEVLGEECGPLAHLLEALECGAPPHGGIAIGLDRLVSALCGTANIRNVIAFPKATSGRDLMSEAPSAVAPAELHYYRIRCVQVEQENENEEAKKPVE